MNHLVPCPSCARHVRQSEASCPFCAVELALGHVSSPAVPRVRLGRAATFAFGASLVGATSLVACGGESETGKPGGGGANSMAGGTSVSGTAGAGGNGTGGNGTGGNSAGTNSAGTNSAGTNSAGTFNGMGGNIAQPYGVPPFGGFAPAYGLPPGGNAGTGSGGGDASAGTAGTGGPTPVYGAPPKE